MLRLPRLLAAAVLVAGFLALAEPAHAGVGPTFVDVTTVDDVVNGGDGFVSLREAIDLARTTPDTVIISLAASQVYDLDACAAAGTHDDTNVTGDLDLTTGTASFVTIVGNGSEIHQTCATERVLHDSGTTLELAGVTISGGDIDDQSSTDALGGGLLTNASLIAHQCRFTGNEAYQGGGVFGTNQLSFVECSIDQNAATGGIAGIFGNTASEGIELTRSAVTGNTATSAVVASAQDLRIENSTISGNTTTNTGSTTRVVTATGDIELEHSLVGLDTIGGGTILHADGGLTSFGSVLAQPAGVGAVCDIDGTVTSEGRNLVTDGSCGLVGATDGTTDVDALALGELANNGGSTLTRLPDGESAVIDRIPAAECTLTVDQRSGPRPQTGQCEVGPVEVGLQPDGLVRLGGGAFVGNDDYANSVANQFRSADRRRGQSAVFVVRAENDGETVDDLRVKGLAGNANFTVRFRVGGQVVTGAMTTGSGYLFADVPPGGRRTIEVTVTPKAAAPHGANRMTTVRVTSANGGNRDLVGARVRVI